MQAGTTVGNLVSAIGVRAEDTALVAGLKGRLRTGFRVAHCVSTISKFTRLWCVRSVTPRTPQISRRTSSSRSSAVSIRFEGDSSLRTWMYRIALREASNQRRWWSRHKRQEITIDSPRPQSDDDGQSLCLSATLADE